MVEANGRLEWEISNTGGTKRTVRLEKYAVVFTPFLQLVLWAVWVEFNLVHGGNDLPGLLKMLEVGNTPVRHTNGLGFPGLIDLFHLFPGLRLVPGPVNCARSVRVQRK